MKVYKGESLDLKLYGDASTLVWDLETLDRGGMGYSAGLLARINYGDDPVKAARIRAEVRAFDADYVPTYFDTFYEIQKFQYSRTLGSGVAPTKLAEVKSRAGAPMRYGYYLEATWAIQDWIAVGLALEDATPLVINGESFHTERNFLAHIEVPYLEWLQFFVTYHKRGFTQISDIWNFKGTDTLLYTGARLQVLPFLFVNAAYQQAFTFGRRVEDTVEGGLNVASNVSLDVEIGWEF
jgi:hypothetical protein